MRRYKIINDSLGWLMFVVAAVTYLLTMEPTASFWDCPEFISQGFKLEIGHPPGNPIFMLAARFAINFTNDISNVALCVNAMSALLSAGTILLLFWTITHLVKRLVVADDATGVSLTEMLVIFGSGVCGALVYTWSDTFWFSAVEAEVYAFSSFCTALVFWLILKWENRADEPHSDRWLVLIAYVIGVSVAVHLLNLLCIPAIVLVFYYKKFKNTNAKGSLLALLLSFGIIVLILYGLVPGFVEVAQDMELFFVNTLGMSFNSGVLFYTIALFGVFIWSIYELYKQASPTRIKLSFFLSIFLSGMLFIGDGFLIPAVLTVALIVYLYKYCNRIPARIFALTVMSIFVIFIGYSSYALILIRSNAQTPMDQNSPDNVFALGSYLNREQYGDRPLLYGQTFNAGVVYKDNGQGAMKPVKIEGKALYAKEVKTDPAQPDRYKQIGTADKYVTSPEMDMLFPRMHSGAHAREYKEWIGMVGTTVNATTQLDKDGNTISTEPKVKPTFVENLRFFIDYQLNYMYWRYFMWNFVGRQNDIQGSGEITHGNWISGIPVIDNARLGDQSLLPSDLGEGNKGHNVFYMLPLLLGIIGLLWQAYAGKRGIEQFWVIFFLFFMTGIAIVIYLNQTPSQPRERDYAFAGSFYAFAIWVGMGVAGLWKLILAIVKKAKKADADAHTSLIAAVAAALVGIFVPLQMVGQTWDDHDRSGRYPARDFGMNYLSSVAPNGIIFTNGDNDTFPLWYCQEVEGYRTDVRVVNLSYLTTDWYINQMRRPSYESAPLPMQASALTFAYDERQYNYFIEPDQTPTTVLQSLAQLYSGEYKNNPWHLPQITHPVMYIPVDSAAVVAAGIVAPERAHLIEPRIDCNMLADKYTAGEMAMSSSKVMTLDIIASSAAQGWKRPVYFAMTVPDRYYVGLSPYMESTGMAYQVMPMKNPLYEHSGEIATNTKVMYDNVMTKFRWAGLDADQNGDRYWDETIRRMVTTTRSALTDLAYDLIAEGSYDKARTILNLMDEKLPVKAVPYSLQLGMRYAQIRKVLADRSGNSEDKAKALDIIKNEVLRYAGYVRFYQALTPDLYNRLAYTDQYIDQRYFIDLLQFYNEIDEPGMEKLITEVTAMGVNIDRIYDFVRAQSQAQQQTAAAVQEEYNEEEEADDAADFDLSAAFGE
ncbi:MAG: DUF2723 domain-containing protein [Bacteroidales bacterium]|nr:DUF2723 domain-containing protein [Bacteroidales bacterium]